MKKVYVGMSGGVDSSVAAFLLKEQGFDVVGFTLDLWKTSSISGLADAKSVCDRIGIKHEIIEFKSEFKKNVVEKFLDEYKHGRTPNPCILCNKYIKFGAVIDYISDKADYVATGHYAKIVYDENTCRYHFEKSADKHKDQTYMFHALTQHQISKILMPLGGYEKSQVREIAAENGFVSANSRDSQDICFLEGVSLCDFISQNAPNQLKSGDIINKKGDILGKHKGISNYTIGQRKGLNIASDRKIYVTDIDAETNTVVLDDEKYIFSDTLYASEVNFHPFETLSEPISAQAKIRYAAKPAECVIYPHENGVRVVFKQPQRAITPGQSVVFYDEKVLLGGGIIDGCDKPM